jgi:(p)ppGpp synthase/HD superfamily hydrolase
MTTIDSTIDFIKDAHAGAFDKTGFPYWEHPYRVMQHLGAKATNEERKAALLHDVVEDTSYTLDDLGEMGYTTEVLDIVKLLTIDKALNMPYIYHIVKIANSGNISAIKIKIADIMDNTDPDRLILVEDAEKLLRKYNGALRVLLLTLLKCY